MKLISKKEILRALNKIDPNFQQVVYHSDIRIADAQLDSCEEEAYEMMFKLQTANAKALINLAEKHEEIVREIFERAELIVRGVAITETDCNNGVDELQALKQEVNNGS